MAEEKKGKRTPYKFDFEKQKSFKYDFRKEEDEEETVAESSEKKKNGHGAIIAIAAAVVCVGIAVYAWNNYRSNEVVTKDTTSNAEVVTSNEDKQQIVEEETTPAAFDAAETSSQPSDVATASQSDNSSNVTEASSSVNSNTTEAYGNAASADNANAGIDKNLQKASAESGISELKSKASPKATTAIGKSDVDKMAYLVIRGNYGNGERRKALLGDSYTTIQNRVNDLYRAGEVH